MCGRSWAWRFTLLSCPCGRPARRLAGGVGELSGDSQERSSVSLSGNGLGIIPCALRVFTCGARRTNLKV